MPHPCPATPSGPRPAPPINRQAEFFTRAAGSVTRRGSLYSLVALSVRARPCAQATDDAARRELTQAEQQRTFRHTHCTYPAAARCRALPPFWCGAPRGPRS